MSLLEIQDSDLLEGARRLDRNALEALHDRYYPQVYRYVYFRLGEAQSSAQVAAQVFTRLLAALGKKRGPKTNLEAWLFAQAARLVDDQLHAHTGQGSHSLVAHATGQKSEAAVSDSQSQEYRQILFVQLALSELSPGMPTSPSFTGHQA